ncbi:ATPase associated with various cellular activities AAA_3 [Cellulomonas flavigena DSM 20109]|uniref:ATPase associated with various cellular activities AAA_3 n=1 Tax=Cellulomonas flavigena (strain ATCC 482 / DSM 20109 / BCRC 11376 / JCM 18109 / NBRC 3775 / NCIMB 8073 / NRS 134) TaxID=446466 RepID=D5UDS6_CELFN|nr:MoxR family ATPase [Cellulomonas flavigena]ADG74484.1 ATPase associated with various cellular activities AAA_3 [Cellulomonas flavigena DSM 20109]
MQSLPSPDELARLVDTTTRLRAGIESVVTGRPDLVRTSLAVLLAEGHLLLEDVPGVGKTTLAKAIARSIDAQVGRIQFTPDLLPSDLTGVNIFRAQTHEFEFRPGPVFAHVVIGDEINRASPKTQSALLECMQEAQATVDGRTYPLPRPFLVVATQNPVEMEGTYPLPEAQRDRFMARLTVGYPSVESELDMLDLQEDADPFARLRPVTDAAEVLGFIGVARRLYAAPAVKRYIVDLVTASRADTGLRLGASPRASIQLLRAAKSLAAMAGRDHVLPDDVQELAVPVLAHRLVPSTESRLSGRTTQDVVTDIVARTALPAAEPLARARRALG